MNLSVLSIAPIGTRDAGFCTAEFKGARPVHVPVYPPHPRGERLRAKRKEWKIGLREAAKLLGMSAADLSHVESGSGEFADETAYAWCEARMAAHAEGAPF